MSVAKRPGAVDRGVATASGAKRLASGMADAAIGRAEARR
jgi:hypothetical protein